MTVPSRSETHIVYSSLGTVSVSNAELLNNYRLNESVVSITFQQIDADYFV